MKLAKKDKIYIFFIVLLSVLLIGLFILTISGWFYSDNSKSETFLKIGNSAVIEVEETSSNVLSYNFDGAILGGEEVKQNISIKNVGENDVFLRAKISFFASNHAEPKIFFANNSMWILENDGYYYFDGYLNSLSTIALTRGFVFSNEQIASKGDYIMSVIVESLSTNFDRAIVWGY